MDIKIITGDISADESALTGESLPKELQPSDIVHSSSIVKRGEAIGVVVNTGANTFFGRTVELVKIAKPKSKQEELLMTIVKLNQDIKTLTNRNLIGEAATAESTGGRKPALYDVNPCDFYIIGIDISRTYTQVVITNLKYIEASLYFGIGLSNFIRFRNPQLIILSGPLIHHSNYSMINVQQSLWRNAILKTMNSDL